MKIRKVTTGSTGPFTGKVTDEKAQKIRVDQKKFEDSLTREQSHRFQERIEILLQEIEEQGKKMANSLNLKELLIYKNKIKAFMEETIEGMFKYTRSSTMDRRGRHRIFSLVKKINLELEELTNDMMSGQKDKLKILEKADNIRGLLIDLYT